MILATINVSKVIKEHLKRGKKGVYLDVVLRECPANPYGDDYLIVQSLSKEARAAGERGEIIGNARTYVPPQTPKGQTVSRNEAPEDVPDIPF